MEELLVRCSALGNITHFDSSTTITKKQLDTIGLLESKENRTEKQQQELDRLIEKRDAKPVISKGAKTYIKDVFFGDKFDFQKTFTNKFTEKGNKKEDPAISEIVKYLGLPMVFKNENHYNNEFIKGTPDVILKPLNFQFDVKNAYYPNGLDSFDEKVDHNYEWQAHGYNWLTGVDYGFVIKILLNPPKNLLDKEIRMLWVEAGNEWSKPIDDDFYSEAEELFNFEKKPIEDRIKIFKIQTTSTEIEMIKESVLQTREYYKELVSLWKNKNVKEIELINRLIKQ